MVSKEQIQLVDKFFSGEFSPEEEHQFFERLSWDEDLYKEFERTRIFVKRMGSEESVKVRTTLENIYAREASRKLRKQHIWHSNAFRVGAAAIITAAVILSSLLIYRNFSSDNDGVAELANNRTHQDATFDNATLNKRMESMIESTFRNEITFSELPNPNMEARKNDKLLFSWHTNAPLILTIRLFDANDNQLIEIHTMMNKLEINVPEENGVYYWVTETSNEYLQAGRFYVSGQ